MQKFGKGLTTELRDLAGHYQDIIIDTGGRDSVELRAALVVAKRAYIPIQPSKFDIWTLSRIKELVHTTQSFNPALAVYIVISRASPHPAVTEWTEAQEAVSDFAHLQLASAVIHDRIAYCKAAHEGLGVPN